MCAKAAPETETMDKLPFAIQGRPKKTVRHFGGAEGAARTPFNAGKALDQSAFAAKSELHKGIQSHAKKKEKLGKELHCALTFQQDMFLMLQPLEKRDSENREATFCVTDAL